MRVLLQRVQSANVEIDQVRVAEIDYGMLLLVGIHGDDDLQIVEKMCRKIIQLRIFPDDQQKMNLDALQIKAQCLVVSQFTLYADCKKGNRPSFTQSAEPSKAKALYEAFVMNLEKLLAQNVPTGRFGAHMQVQFINDGPVSIWLDSAELF
jgi:D-tyrosyl-tRNA(Tyr) deacylase